MGRTDAGVRWTAAAALFLASIVLSANALLSLGAAVVALVLVATALTRKCPLYTLVGANTCPRNPKPVR